MKPTLGELTQLLITIKATIADDYRASNDPEDDTPGIQITIATDDSNSEWSYQTGDNSYTGGCYHFPHWAVGAVYRDSNCKEVARQLLDELAEAMPD